MSGMDGWRRVLATHEEKQELATGPWLGDSFPGIALPCRLTLGKWFVLRLGSLLTFAQQVDVGPWCVDDDSYVLNGHQPRAERFKGEPCPLTIGGVGHATLPDGTVPAACNGAGIDLFPRVANQLRIPLGANVIVEWKPLDPSMFAS